MGFGGGWPGILQGMAETLDAPPLDPSSAPGVAPSATRVWGRRIAILALVAGAFAVLAYGCSRGDTSATKSADPVIVEQFPGPGARALRQTEVGAELQQGYDGRLTINGIAIPEGQMEGAVDPRTTSAKDIKQFGIRPNNRNRVFFQPGPGKVITGFETGQVTIVLRYFPDHQDDGTGRIVSWTIAVN